MANAKTLTATANQIMGNRYFKRGYEEVVRDIDPDFDQFRGAKIKVKNGALFADANYEQARFFAVWLKATGNPLFGTSLKDGRYLRPSMWQAYVKASEQGVFR